MIKRFLAIGLSVFLLMENNIALADDRETFLSEEIQGYCIEIGEKYGICPEVLMAIIERESRGVPDATNGSHIGLMQISTRWHSNRMENLDVEDLTDPYSNILVGADYLMELSHSGYEIDDALEIYNTGRCFDGMTNYSKSILERSAELEILHGK